MVTFLSKVLMFEAIEKVTSWIEDNLSVPLHKATLDSFITLREIRLIFLKQQIKWNFVKTVRVTVCGLYNKRERIRQDYIPKYPTYEAWGIKMVTLPSCTVSVCDTRFHSQVVYDHPSLNKCLYSVHHFWRERLRATNLIFHWGLAPIPDLDV